MKAYHFHAVVYDDRVLCVDCLPPLVMVDNDAVYPIFASSEWDIEPVCDACGRAHDYITLTRKDTDNV